MRSASAAPFTITADRCCDHSDNLQARGLHRGCTAVFRAQKGTNNHAFFDDLHPAQAGAQRPAGEFKTVHGTVQTPAFQNVATAGAIKGGLSAQDLKDIGAQVMLCNTYHLHLRPGDKLVADMGGLHKFTRWNGPILTDSGGFQVFSLAKLRKITEEGVTFASHLDGHRIFMGPEESMQIQANLALPSPWPLMSA